jgi:uracil-DNA glycosylase family 4
MNPKEICDCENCPYSIDGLPNRPVFAIGPGTNSNQNTEPLAIIVGESPGEDEYEAGKPFVGRTGKALDRELEFIGLDRSKLLIVNACLCKPLDKTSRRMAKAVRCCKPAFEYQVGRFRNNKHFFLMGRFAAYVFYGKFMSLNAYRGFIIEDNK